MNSKKRIKELEKEIFELEHTTDKNKVGRFEPKLIPLYREYQELTRKKEN